MHVGAVSGCGSATIKTLPCGICCDVGSNTLFSILSGVFHSLTFQYLVELVNFVPDSPLI
jgi:hypothetical protein